jgi:hypothetical protein
LSSKTVYIILTYLKDKSFAWTTFTWNLYNLEDVLASRAWLILRQYENRAHSVSPDRLNKIEYIWNGSVLLCLLSQIKYICSLWKLIWRIFCLILVIISLDLEILSEIIQLKIWIAATVVIIYTTDIRSIGWLIGKQLLLILTQLGWISVASVQTLIQ